MAHFFLKKLLILSQQLRILKAAILAPLMAQKRVHQKYTSNPSRRQIVFTEFFKDSKS